MSVPHIPGGDLPQEVLTTRLQENKINQFWVADKAVLMTKTFKRVGRQTLSLCWASLGLLFAPLFLPNPIPYFLEDRNEL